MTHRTSPEARQALRQALHDVDNAVAAGRALERVATRCQFEASSWEAFRLGAEEELATWLPDGAKTVAWAILDRYVGRNGSRPEERVGPDDATDDVTPDRAFPLLSELLDHPELLEPPEEVVPRLAWRGRTTGLVGPDKSGKSTKAAHAVAALSRGARWLGEPVTHGRAVVAAPDEAVGDTVRRLHELGADASLVRVLVLRPPDLLASLEGLLEAHPADLVVVDSLAEWARLTLGTAPEDGDAAGWGAVVRPLVHVSRAHDCAVLLLHHPRRSDGQYRGSGEIAAALDCLLEMRSGQQGEDPTLRRITGRARWPVEDYSIRLDGDKYVLGAGGSIPMDARVLMDARAHPGTSRAASYERLGGRKQSHSAAVNRLVESGGLVDRGGLLFHPDHVEEDLL